MIIRELIEELKKCEPDNEVIFFVGPDYNLEHELAQVQSDEGSATTGIHIHLA